MTTSHVDALKEQVWLICDLAGQKNEPTIELLADNVHAMLTDGVVQLIDPIDPPPPPPEPLQDRTERWMLKTFPSDVICDRTERMDRLIEEVFELAQSIDYDFDRISKLASYVGGREKGRAHEEIGGVANTLFALCNALNISFGQSYVREMERVETPEMIAKIRAKWESKPKDIKSPLPGKYP